MSAVDTPAPSHSRVIVGYQGIPGSHSERAAGVLLARAGITEYTLAPCVTAGEVVARLESGRVDLGVLALRNAVGGEVMETVEATRNRALRERMRCELPIIHGLYGRASSNPDRVTTIYSHEQALRQCAGSIRRWYPDAACVAEEDTALAAERLAAGAYPEGAAVICSRTAAERLGLHAIRHPFQDRPDNLTEFALVQCATQGEREA
jgi:prephenate dehydratase